MKRSTKIVGKGTVADDLSNQFAKFIIKKIVKTKVG